MKPESSYNEMFMQRAIELSEIAYRTHKGLPVGCVIVKDGQIVGEGHNENFSRKSMTAHAEMLAIDEACRNLNSMELKGCQLYTTLEPCPMCVGAIYWVKVDAVYFANTAADAIESGFKKNNIIEELQKSPESRTIPMRHLKSDQAYKVLKSWQDETDSIAGTRAHRR